MELHHPPRTATRRSRIDYFSTGPNPWRGPNGTPGSYCLPHHPGARPLVAGRAPSLKHEPNARSSRQADRPTCRYTSNGSDTRNVSVRHQRGMCGKAPNRCRSGPPARPAALRTHPRRRGRDAHPDADDQVRARIDPHPVSLQPALCRRLGQLAGPPRPSRAPTAPLSKAPAITDQRQSARSGSCSDPRHRPTRGTTPGAATAPTTYTVELSVPEPEHGYDQR